MAKLKTLALIVLTLCLLPLQSTAHTIYEPNDIPLLDNRFRIDPNTEQVTIILNHQDKPQKIVIVRPDGSKLYEQRHPKSEVSWVSTRDQDIITVDNPMPGPWQAIAKLHGDNRIRLLNPVTLRVDKLPLKLYHNEYLTTHVALIEGSQILTDKHFLDNAKLTVSLQSPARRLISLYKDDGKKYDSLPFDGQLTAHLFVNLAPGRYKLNIKTKNDIFIRNYSQEAIVFPSPVQYQLNNAIEKSEVAVLTFAIDSSEIKPQSVTIDGLFTSNNETNNKQSIIHLSEHQLIEGKAIIEVPLTHDLYTYTAKVFATTNAGREISFKLQDRIIELLPPIQPIFIEPEESAALSQALPSISDSSPETTDIAETQTSDETEDESSLLWWIIGGSLLFILLIAVAVIFILKRNISKNNQDQGLSLDQLTQDDLQPTPIDIDKAKK